MNEKIEVEWKCFKEEKPGKAGIYLWSVNNWRTADMRGNKVHSYNVKAYYWSGPSGGFFEGDHGVISPDQWAEYPFPKKIEKPTS